eukprot:348093_1
MATLLKQQHQQLVKEWNAISKSKNCEDIIAYFETNKQSIISSGKPWFLKEIIKNDNIEIMKYILQHTNPIKYINTCCQATGNDWPISYACRVSSFEMIKLMVYHGATYTGTNWGPLGYIIGSQKMTNDEIYLCIEYLLDSLDGQICDDQTVNALITSKNMRCDCIKLANLIKKKRPLFINNLSKNYLVSDAIKNHDWEFAEYMIQNGGTLSCDLFVNAVKASPNDEDDMIIKWLLKQGLNINGYLNNQEITALFRCCTENKYEIMEFLINNGADLYKKCRYNDENMSALEYCEKHFEQQYYQYFKNYKVKTGSNDSTLFVGIDLSNIPNIYQSNWTVNDDEILKEINDEYRDKQQKISVLENEIKIKYIELRELIGKQTEIKQRHKNVEKWKKGQNDWISFINKWKQWNIWCFIEYLKRVKYINKSYYEYYSSDNICKQKIENYIKNNLDSFEEKDNENNDNMSHFKSLYLG